MKTILQLYAGKICRLLFIATLLLPLCVLAQQRTADGMYSGTNYTINERPKPNKTIQQNGKKTNDSLSVRVSDPRQKPAFPALYQLSVYPNPAVSDARLVFSSKENGVPYQLSLVTADGKRMWQRKGSTLNGVNTVNINMSNYPAGGYYFQLMVGNSMQVIQLVKLTQ